ncbi:MAG: hypothetical protein KF799_14230 [Bdellovibrionales bacterium]|nr:hypothetical protein [Bdellovibrionales bacterium]
MSDAWDDLEVKLRATLFIVISLVLAYAYLYPGSQAWLERRTDIVMSDGTDITAVPYSWDLLKREWEQHPSHWLYGTVWADAGDPERGNPMWIAWSERLISLPSLYINSVEQSSASIAIALILLNVLTMYGLGRILKWPPWIAFALALAWGFCAYTRARAQVHPSLAGTYHIPLLFIGLLLTVRGVSWRSTAAATLAFLAAAMAPHYYVVTAVFLTPALLIYVYLQPEFSKEWRRILVRLCAATLPAILFLAFNLRFTIPSDAKLSATMALPATGETATGELHPFLSIYAARPIDFFTSDLGLAGGLRDPNPLKTVLNEAVVEDLTKDGRNGNAHERTNGIRWLIWLLAAAALVTTVRKPRGENRTQIWFFAGLAAFTFCLSLSPEALGYGPSAWLYKLVSQIRVSARAGTWVHFCLLMITGIWLSSSLAGERLRRWAALPALLAVMVVLEYPPLWQTVRMAEIAPPYATLARDKGACGTGMYFPLVSNHMGSIVYYRFLQRTRGSDCHMLNSFADLKRLSYITNLFPPTGEYLANLAGDMITPIRLQKLAQCVPLSFVAFDPAVPIHLVSDYCKNLGWLLTEDRLCVSPQKGVPLAKFPDQCEI